MGARDVLRGGPRGDGRPRSMARQEASGLGAGRRGFDRTDAAAGSYRFQVESLASRPGAVLRASYTGALPDLFRSRAEVMLFGTLLPGQDVLRVRPDGI